MIKKYLCLLIVATGFLLVPKYAAAQPTQEVYLRSDELFKNIASVELTAANKTTLENFGQAVENDLTIQNNRERKAASLLFKLQTKPTEVTSGFTAISNAAPQQKALQANKLFTEYTSVLIGTVPPSADDPLRNILDKLKSEEGQRALNADLQIRLGQGAEREDKAAKLFSQIKLFYSAENLQKLRIILKNSTTQAVLPYPLCVANNSCPK